VTILTSNGQDFQRIAGPNALGAWAEVTQHRESPVLGTSNVSEKSCKIRCSRLLRKSGKNTDLSPYAICLDES
jgi:hypothetical protein